MDIYPVRKRKMRSKGSHDDILQKKQDEITKLLNDMLMDIERLKQLKMNFLDLEIVQLRSRGDWN